ncbi:MAG: hypothetical protein QNJ84_13090 [Alphaproteobacteria bacterium]|nr:hypothetical protein [Alphaproteobacteria bacterium]
MKIDRKDPPRRFSVKGVTLSHCADVALEPGEFVTFTGPEGKEYDVTAKDWGFYATPSTNGRLKRIGLRTALARSTATGMRFVLIVDPAKTAAFEAYCADQEMVVEAWLDEDVPPG